MTLEQKLNEAVGQYQALQQSEQEARGRLEDLTQQRLQAWGRLTVLDELYKEELEAAARGTAEDGA